MTWITLFLGCGEADTVTEVVLDFEATCAQLWPEDQCGGGDCGTTEVEDRWISAFTTAFATGAGIPESAVADHARVRSISGAPDIRAITEATWQFDIDWVRVVEHESLHADGDAPTDDDLVDSWGQGGLAPDLALDTELMAYTDAQDFIDDCAAQHGVTFDASGWCEPYYANDGDRPDRSQLRVDFHADLGGYDYVLASVDLTGVEEPRCSTNQITIE